MSELNQTEKYTRLLGKLLSNILSLEFLLRVFLYNTQPEKQDNNLKLNLLKDGDLVSENYLTNSSTLSPLIERYNSHCRGTFDKFKISPDLVEIRNAIAHGRVSSVSSDLSQMQLLNFDKPEDDEVKVRFAVHMTEDWLKEEINRFLEAIHKVENHIKTVFPDVIQ